MTRRNQSNAHGLSLRTRAHCTADKPFPHKSVRTRTRVPSCLHTNFTTSPRSRIQRYQYPVAVQTWEVQACVRPTKVRPARLGQQACHLRRSYPVNIFGSISEIQHWAPSLRLLSYSQHDHVPDSFQCFFLFQLSILLQCRLGRV